MLIVSFPAFQLGWSKIDVINILRVNLQFSLN